MVTRAPGLFEQIIVIAVEGLGAGELADAAEYNSRGANTLGNAATYVGGLELPYLSWLGLGNITPLRGADPADVPAASYALLGRTSTGSDSVGGVAEMMGDVVDRMNELGYNVSTFGGAEDLLRGLRGTAGDNVDEVLGAVTDAASSGRGGLLLATVSTGGATLGAHGPVSTARTLERLDAALSRLLDDPADDALLLITGTSGADSTLASVSGSTREYVPLLAYSKQFPSGIELGKRGSLADIGATLAENFGFESPAGQSFYGPLTS